MGIEYEIWHSPDCRVSIDRRAKWVVEECDDQTLLRLPTLPDDDDDDAPSIEWRIFRCHTEGADLVEDMSGLPLRWEEDATPAQVAAFKRMRKAAVKTWEGCAEVWAEYRREEMRYRKAIR